MSRSAPTAAADPWVLDVFECARTGSTCEGQLSADRLARLAASVESIDAPAQYRWTGTVGRQGEPGGLLEFVVELTQRCDLCGSRCPHRIAAQREFRFAASDSELARRPLDPDDAIDWLVGSSRFDLADLVDEEAVLALPLSPRHPACQAALDARTDLPAGSGPDSGSGPTRPFAALARLKSGPH